MWIESAQLNLEITGEDGGGPNVLMVHGAGGRAGLWRSLAGRLAPEYRTAALDLSGHGESAARAQEHVLETYAQDILSAVDALGGEPVVLAGHSMGGGLAQYMALEHPEAVRGIVLAATGARLRVLPALIKQFSTPDPSQAITMMTGAAFAPGADPELVASYTESLKAADPAIVVQDFRICDAFDIMPRLGDIQKPCLIICGDKDNLTPLKYSTFLKERIPGSELHVVPDCGHMVMLEAPDAFAELLCSFLKRLP